MKDREKELSKVTLWGAVANVLLAFAKLAAGLWGRSSAMVADAVHSFSDLVSDVVVIVMVKLSSKDRDKSHDYGHGKFETLATVTVALMLVAVAVKLMVEGVEKIASVLEGGIVEMPGKIALWAALASIAVKEALYQWTVRVGRKYNSPAVVANAWHHRTDALSSIGAAVGIGFALLLGGKWVILDPIVCCAISVFIFVAALQMVIPALGELTDASLSDEVEAEISGIIQSVPGVGNVHNLKTRRNGPDIIIDAHMVVAPEMTVSEAHKLTTIAENLLRERFGADTQIMLHVEPSVESD